MQLKKWEERWSRMKEPRNSRTILIIILALLAIVSATLLRSAATSVDTYAPVIEVLEKEKNTVMKLTAASTSASAFISMLPEDAGTPIAQQLAQLSTYFLLIVSILYLEKYLDYNTRLLYQKMKQEIPKHKMNKARSKHEAEALVCFLLEYFFLAMKEFFQVQSDNSFLDTQYF